MSTIVTQKKLTAKELLDKIKNKSVTPVATGQKEAPKVRVNHGDVVAYYVEYADGTSLLAQGKAAHLIYRFTMKAQELATMHAFAYYDGPPMPEMTKEEALKLLVGKGGKNG
jgi:hypothetical protein